MTAARCGEHGVGEHGVEKSGADEADVVVVGGGPAGLSAALSLVRARRRTLVLDANRPRNAATLHTHGFLTRDGVSPVELRRLGREEVAAYDEGEVAFARVTRVAFDRGAFLVSATGIRGAADRLVRSRVVLVASGLVEALPALPSIRAFYGMSLHSCIECDGYEKAGEAVALIGTEPGLAQHALLLRQWTEDLIVFTNGSHAVTLEQEGRLASRGIGVERRAIEDVVGERDRMTGIRLADGEVVGRTAGFVRPGYRPALEYLDGLGVATDEAGLIVVDEAGRTSVRGLYATGESTPPGPEQLIVAAGNAASTAAAINRDLLGL